MSIIDNNVLNKINYTLIASKVKYILSLLLFCVCLQKAEAWIPKPIAPPKLKINQVISIAMSHSKNN